MLYSSTGFDFFLFAAAVSSVLALLLKGHVWLTGRTLVRLRWASSIAIALFLLLALVLWEPARRHLDEVLLGALFGILLAIWGDWLLRGRAEGEASQGFRLLTLTLVFLFCMGAFRPYFDRWFTQASNVDVGAWGLNLKLSLQQPNGSRANETVFGPQGAAVDRAAALRGPGTALNLIIELARGTDSAAEASGEGRHWCFALSKPQVLYQDQSVIQRDLLIAAFLGSRGPDDAARDAEFRRQLKAACGNGSWAQSLHLPFAVFEGISGPFACAQYYANLISDYRLLLLDIHPVIRAFLALSRNDQVSEAKPETRDDIAFLSSVLEALVAKVREELHNFPIAAEAVSNVCGSTVGSRLREAIKAETDGASRLDNETPYLGIATAALFNSIGAFESALSVLTSWAQAPRTGTAFGEAADTDMKRALSLWLKLRIVFEIDALLDGRPEFFANDGYQQMLVTAAELVRGARPDLEASVAQNACRPPAGAGLFAQTQQYFHFNMIVLRQRYFQTLRRLDDVSQADVREAGQYADLGLHCFNLVRAFAENPEAWLGYFALMHADLLAKQAITNFNRYGREAAAGDFDAARRQYSLAQARLQRGVRREESRDQDRPSARAFASRGAQPNLAANTESAFPRLEQKLLGRTRVWSNRLEQARAGLESLELAMR